MNATNRTATLILEPGSVTRSGSDTDRDCKTSQPQQRCERAAAHRAALQYKMRLPRPKPRVAPLNRSAAFTPLPLRNGLWHQTLKRPEGRAPSARFMGRIAAHQIMKTSKLILLIALMTATAFAVEPPGILNYQGLVNVNGAAFTGAGQFKFALVDAAGTTTYWSNDGNSTGGNEPTAAVSLAVSSGRYSVALGDTTVANMTAAIPASVFRTTRTCGCACGSMMEQTAFNSSRRTSGWPRWAMR